MNELIKAMIALIIKNQKTYYKPTKFFIKLNHLEKITFAVKVLNIKLKLFYKKHFVTPFWLCVFVAKLSAHRQ